MYNCIRTAHDKNSFAIPFVVTIVLCSVAGLVAVFSDRHQAKLLQNAFVGLSLVLFVLCVFNWSHGDDGQGMILIGGVGPSLLGAALLSLFSTAKVLQDD